MEQINLNEQKLTKALEAKLEQKLINGGSALFLRDWKDYCAFILNDLTGLDSISCKHICNLAIQKFSKSQEFTTPPNVINLTGLDNHNAYFANINVWYSYWILCATFVANAVDLNNDYQGIINKYSVLSVLPAHSVTGFIQIFDIQSKRKEFLKYLAQTTIELYPHTLKSQNFQK